MASKRKSERKSDEIKAEAKRPPSKVIYIPPADAVIDQFARDVSLRLAEEQNDLRYKDNEVITGLAEFLKVVAQLKANELNHSSIENTGTEIQVDP